MHLASRAFENGGRIPGRFTCDGDNEMPPLEWTGVPPEARSLALVCSDPDAPSGTFHHWAVYDIPPDVRHLPERTRAGMREAVNDFGRTGYGGPCPTTRARFSPLLFPALRPGYSDARPGPEGPLPGGRAPRPPARPCRSRPHRALRSRLKRLGVWRPEPAGAALAADGSAADLEQEIGAAACSCCGGPGSSTPKLMTVPSAEGTT
jgi:hypothetical protein